MALCTKLLTRNEYETHNATRKKVLALSAIMIMMLVAMGATTQVSAQPALIDGATIPKYVNQLTGPPPVYVANRNEVTVRMSQFQQQVLPAGYPKTTVWGYGGDAKDALTGKFLGFVQNAPGPTFEATRGKPFTVTYINQIYQKHMFAVDPTIHWANPNKMAMPMLPVTAPPFPPGYIKAQWPVPLVTHLHGGEVQSTSDGGPEAWFTVLGQHEPGYSTSRPTAPNAAVYTYPNGQPATTLFYHDHALGQTRLNVHAGLAGFYLIRDPADTIAPKLPSGKYEMPLALADRNFKTDGSMFFPSDGVNPTIHPYWRPEFFGDTILVNGLVWPNMNVLIQGNTA